MKHPSELHRPSQSWPLPLHAPRRARTRRRAVVARLGAMLFALAAGGTAWIALPDLHRPSAPATQAPVRAEFGFCHSGGGDDCVVDGDTFRMGGDRIRIADIDTPETHPARCPREAELGEAATRRLHALLNAGPVALAPIDRDTDRYGRKLRIVFVDGRGVGDTLIAEGLARRYEGGRRAGWCD